MIYSGDPTCLDEGIEMWERALPFEPDNPYQLDVLGVAHVQKGLLEEGIKEIERAVKHSNSYAADLAYAYVKAGRVEDARNLLQRLLDDWEKTRRHSTVIAGVYSELGDSKSYGVAGEVVRAACGVLEHKCCGLYHRQCSLRPQIRTARQEDGFVKM